MNINDVQSHYTKTVDKYQSRSNSLKKTIFQIGTLRLIIFILCCFAVYWCWGQTSTVFSIVAVGFIAFLALMQYHNSLYKKKQYSDEQVKNAKNELKGLNYDFSAFDNGEDKIETEHSFSLDLDIFGKRSFFQSLNRTVTSFGKDKLADTLIYPFENKEKILSQQESVRELAAHPELLAHFRALGQITEMDKLNTRDFSESFSKPPLLANSIFWKSMLYIIPLIHIIAGTLIYFDILPGGYYTAIYILTLIVSGIPLGKVGQISDMFDNKSKVLGTYAELMTIIEKETFKSSQLKELQSELSGTESASKSIKQLQSYYNNLTVSKTFPVFLIFNPYLVWAVRYAIKIEKWTQIHKKYINKWFNVLAQFDALVSLSTFAFNHPDYTYPTPADQFIFEGEALGHPMINRNVCVRNDVHLSKSPFFLVITGANMAGKSTYLRTIGINHTLACTGAPVYAKKLTFYPGRLVTNLRTADSLADNESYFFAELKRLKMIIDRLQAGEELFIILDEILKGTNSEDKQKGSLALMKQLIALKGNGIIATHDLVLGNLENEYPDNVKDYRFEADITDNNLAFSYKIREGVAQNMNACFLMKKMGITGL